MKTEYAAIQTDSTVNASLIAKILYWGSTGLLSAMMLFSAVNYLTSDQMIAAFQHLGFPSYFRLELAFAKILGVAAILLLPRWARVKEWAYAGFGFTFISAFIAHTSLGDPASAIIAPLVAFTLLVVSYKTSDRVRR